MKLKNLLFVLLALALVLSLGVCAAAEGGDAPDVVVSGTLELGDAQYTFYSDGNLVLEGNGPVYGVYMDEPMEPYFNDIKTLTVGEGITSLNGLVFTNCKNLETVKLPKSFHITEDNFINCPHLKQFIVNPDNPTHAVDAVGALYKKDMTVLYKYVTGSSATVYTVANETEVIWEYAFSNCAALEKVVLPDSVTTIQNEAFLHCLALREINLPNSLTSLEAQAFFGCSSLQQITLPNQITEIGVRLFGQCTGLTSFTIPAHITKIGMGAFENCTALEEIELHDGITEIGNAAFSYCRSLKQIVLPERISEIADRLFYNDIRLQQITIPAGVRRIGKNAFAGYADTENGATPLKDVYIYMGETTWNSDVTVEEGNDRLLAANLTFMAPSLLESGNCGAEGSNAQYQLYTDGTLIISGTGDVRSDAFRGRADIEEVIICSYITGLGDYAFDQCSNLKRVILPATVQTISGKSFYDCPSLIRFFLSNGNDYLAIDAVGRLYNKDMTVLIKWPAVSGTIKDAIPDTVTTIVSGASYGCSTLEEFSIPGTLTTVEREAFVGCDALTDVVVKMSERKWNQTVTVAAGNDCLLQANLHFRPDEDDGYRWVSIPTSSTGLQKGDLYLDFSDFAGQIDPENRIALLGDLKAGNWFVDIDAGVLKGSYEVYVGGSGFMEERWIFPDESKPILVSALCEAGVTWITLPYSADGLQNGDWYLDLDAFVDAVGRGKTEEEKAEVRNLLLQHVTFRYNPGGNAFVYRFDYDKLPVEDGDPISGSVDLPIGLFLEDENAFPYDYNALKNCVQQYRAPDAPDEPDEPDQPEENESWFQKHIVGPMRLAISTILSFFRRLFSKSKR